MVYPLAMARSVGLFLVLAATACGTDGLESDPELEPPAGTDAYDPSDGQGEGGGGYYTTTGQVSAGSGQDSAGDETGGSTGAADCAEDARLCAHTFELADDSYGAVLLMGSFADDGWDVGVDMTLQDGTWQAVVDLPWALDTEYRFQVDGSADWLLDPENPDTENDNSVIRALMCTDYAC